MANQNFNQQQRGANYGRPTASQHEPVNLKSYDFKKWIKSQIDNKTVEFADKFGMQIKIGGLTTSQIRNFFGEMRRIQMKGFENQKPSFFLLKPKLAYAVKRHDNKGMRNFYELFDEVYRLIDVENVVEGEKNYKNMMEIMEAVLAYHKFHGGRE
ncbi:MAG TPA: type III-A CRISPR-associated protein Csm2 [Bacteroidales bacterium]|nr:type III-A CRISPR-associated protein Csm2 [Bacteroidales bacterium]